MAAFRPLQHAAALTLADSRNTAALMEQASALCVQGHANTVSYSRKVFIPLTQLCRDVCHYCTFSRVSARATKVR